MVYVALLRGINVGGNAKIEMVKLRQMFGELGYSNVKTFINSGNVIFEDNTHTSSDLVEEIESAITKTFGMKVSVLVRDANNIRAVVDAIPSRWVNDSTMKTDVLFLRPEIDEVDILKKIVVDPKIENVIYDHGVLVWNIARENVTKGNGIKLIKTDVYKSMTARNVNTVRKLNILMSQ